METLQEQRKKASKPLLWIGIGSIIMAFAGMTSGYVVSRTTLLESGKWLVFELPTAFNYSTLAIIASSFTLWHGKRAISSGNSSMFKIYLWLTIILGIVFAVLQVRGWSELVNERVFFAGDSSNPAGSWVYVISLFHLAHLCGGIISLFYTTVRAHRGKYSQEDYHGVQLASIYWHFVDFLWVYLYIFLTLIR
jgi:cytochrome c oxidase subunit 3